MLHANSNFGEFKLFMIFQDGFASSEVLDKRNKSYYQLEIPLQKRTKTSGQNNTRCKFLIKTTSTLLTTEMAPTIFV